LVCCKQLLLCNAAELRWIGIAYFWMPEPTKACGTRRADSSLLFLTSYWTEHSPRRSARTRIGSLGCGQRQLGSLDAVVQWEGNMARCDACGALSLDAHVLEVEGGPTTDRGVVAVRIGLCGSCYFRPERGEIVNRLCAEVLVPPPYWFDRPSAWSSTIREVRSPRGRRTHLLHFLYEAVPFSIKTAGPKPA
jgi:hypothetical protein